MDLNPSIEPSFSDSASLKGTAVLVTGADGFIGSHLTERLLSLGANVRAMCFYNPFQSYGNLQNLVSQKPDNLTVFFGDIRDRSTFKNQLENVEVLFNLAALISIPYSYVAPRAYAETNIMGTLSILEEIRDRSIKIVQISTSEVYGTPESTPITEQHPLRAQSPYSATKIAADKLCESFAYSFGIPVVVLRPFNTFGPRQSLRAVIPTIILQLLAGDGLITLGDVSPQRDLTYVSDTVEGIVQAALCNIVDNPEIVQLGTGRTYSIREIAQMCADLLDKPLTINVSEERIRPANSEVRVLLSDPAKAKKVLGWEPRTNIRDGLKMTIDWFSENPPELNAASYYF